MTCDLGWTERFYKQLTRSNISGFLFMCWSIRYYFSTQQSRYVERNKFIAPLSLSLIPSFEFTLEKNIFTN